jgi:hypothetical protein
MSIIVILLAILTILALAVALAALVVATRTTRRTSPPGAEDASDFVVTPGGPRHRDHVHQVWPDEPVVHREVERSLQKMRPVSARELDRRRPPGFVITPGGPRHHTRVHLVPPDHAVVGGRGGLRLLNRDRGFVRELPDVPDEATVVPALGSGWITYAYWNNGTGSSITSFTTIWKVPPPPANDDGQTIFLFNGIQNYGANFGILQPVLQWGFSAAGGGPSWMAASWYVTSAGTALHSPLVAVNPGDTLVGVMTLTGVNIVPSSPPTFDYNCVFTGLPQTSLNVQNIAELLWCNETLEAYTISKCGDYPATTSTVMGAIAIQTGNTNPAISWTPVNAVTDCGQHALVLSNSSTTGAVDLFYTAVSFAPVYQQGAPGSGIGGYDLKSTADRVFTFDYDGSGKLDHLVLYRPGTGTVWILKNSGGAFSSVYAQGDPGSGIGGYDLKSTADRAFAFDYDGSGKLDHLVLYRPGTGTIWILKNAGGAFSSVYAQGDPGSGIGGYNLKSTADRAFAFDYDSSGKLDHLVLYRPGTGTIWILKNSGGTFSSVYAQGDPGSGIGGYDLKSTADRAFAFDYDGSGKLDHLVLYRPGTGTIWILKNSGGTFSPVYAQGDPGSGIGGYNLKSTADRAFAFDYDGSGKLDHLVLYRPGTGTIWILRNTAGSFSPVYAKGDPGSGIGGYDLLSPADRAFAYDYASTGDSDYLSLYRPGTGTIWILKHAS